MTKPTTEAGRALLDLIDVTFQHLDERREASPDRETAAERIRAIEAEAKATSQAAAKAWRYQAEEAWRQVGEREAQAVEAWLASPDAEQRLKRAVGKAWGFRNKPDHYFDILAALRGEQ